MRFLGLLLLPLTLLGQGTVRTGVANPVPGVAVLGAGVLAGPPKEWTPEELCTLEGRVVNAITGQPISDVTLTLRPAPAVVTSALTGPNAFTTRTDSAGRYAMNGIEPGSYQFMAAKRTFVSMNYGAKAPFRQGAGLSLRPSQRMTGVDFQLTPHGVITGRVVDENGEPMGNVEVSAQTLRYSNGRKQYAALGNATSDDRGIYRIHSIPPGKYVINATARTMTNGTQDRSAGSAAKEGYLPTFYPGATDVRLATTVETAPGQVTQGIDLRLSPSKVTRIRGRIVSQIGNTNIATPSMVRLVPYDLGIASLMNATLASGPQRQFEFAAVPPGSYSVMVQLVEGGKAYNASSRVEVADQDVDDLVVTVTTGIEVPGEIRLEDQDVPLDFTSLNVGLRPLDAGLIFAPVGFAKPDADGKFVITGATPEKFSVNIAALPPTFYVKSVRAGQADALEEGVDLTRGSSGPLQIVISSKAAKVTGVVNGADDKPVSGAFVALVPQETKRKTIAAFYRSINTDQYGHYTLLGVTPGDYKVYAWDDVDNGAWMDPDFLAPFISKGKLLVVHPAGNETADVKALAGDGK